jgi:hypothetical protein
MHRQSWSDEQDGDLSLFRHGPHKGCSVIGLVHKLRIGYEVNKLTPLVVVKLKERCWVVFGNRRLRALRELAAEQAARSTG